MSKTGLLESGLLRQGLGVLIAGLVIGLIGPFGTFVEMPLLARWPYWIAVTALSWLQWRLLSTWLERLTRWPVTAVGSLTGFVFALPMAAEINLINRLLGLGLPPQPALLYLWIAGTALLIFWLVHLILRWVGLESRPPVLEAPPAATFRARIPARIAGDLLCLKTEDHYLRVYTTAGDDLLLMRLRDAVTELAGVEGLQVHRSYWVARAAVAHSAREGRRWFLILKNDLKVPVSQSHLAAVRAAGWLARDTASGA